MSEEDNNKALASLKQSLIAQKSLMESPKMKKALDAAGIVANHLKKQEEMMKKLTNPLGLSNSERPSLNIDDLIPKDYTLASYKYEALMEEITAFQNELTDDFDVAVKLVSFGENMLLAIDKIGYQNPDILFFYGRNSDGNPIELIQHVSQLSFLLVALKKTDISAPPHRIGFVSDDKGN